MTQAQVCNTTVLHVVTCCCIHYCCSLLQVLPFSQTVKVRACANGEVTQTAHLCIACAAPQYSLNPVKKTCDLPCPANARCLGGALLIPQSGYWVSASNSDSIVTCPNAAACHGDRNSLVDCLNTSSTAPMLSGQSGVSTYLMCQLARELISMLCFLCHSYTYCIHNKDMLGCL